MHGVENSILYKPQKKQKTIVVQSEKQRDYAKSSETDHIELTCERVGLSLLVRAAEAQ
jgi:hypothetical protein